MNIQKVLQNSMRTVIITTPPRSIIAAGSDKTNLKNAMKFAFSRSLAGDPTKTLKNAEMIEKNRRFSLFADKEIFKSQQDKDLKMFLRKSGGGSVDEEYQLGHNIPGLRYMMGNQYRCTLVFTLFLLPAWWSPSIIFCVLWAKQMGW